MAASILQKGTVKAVVQSKGSGRGFSASRDGGGEGEDPARDVKRIKLDGGLGWIGLRMGVLQLSVVQQLHNIGRIR